jgi:hypothetical protein
LTELNPDNEPAQFQNAGIEIGHVEHYLSSGSMQYDARRIALIWRDREIRSFTWCIASSPLDVMDILREPGRPSVDV